MVINAGTKTDCLLFFLDHGSEWYTVNQISRQLSLPAQTLASVLDQLAGENRLSKRQVGNLGLYRYKPPKERLIMLKSRKESGEKP